ncbi:caspase family protein [Streptosporangium subroseum]|uniref:caspase family protein n=1 Tax=Streptosporangium subroseum TaxID=106412 RepID=UPI00308BC7C3|nr:caspase family protein [Streptosporangium subroseum]
MTVKVSDEGTDPQELEELTVRLREELLELDVTVTPVEAGQAPPGSRAGISTTLGAFQITLPGTDVLAAIVNAATAWLTRNQGRSIKLEFDGIALELVGLPSKEQRRLTEVWLHRHKEITREKARQENVWREEIAPEEVEHGVTETRAALIVANDDYADPRLRQLRSPAQDAEALARVLGDPEIGRFDVRTMLNQPAHVINEAVEEFFADRRPDDLLLLHFSCHGVKDDGGELYFATTNTKLDRLGATAVSADFVNRRMSRSRSRRVVLLLDCCYAGAYGRGTLPRAGMDIDIREQFEGHGRAVITASNAMEYAFDGLELADTYEFSPSVFTSAVVEGLETGDADRDQDGYVAIDELYDYVYDRVRKATPNQTPGRWMYDVQGDLYIARRGRPVSKPAPLPPDLQLAIDHSIPGVRAAAVVELERLLRSRHEGLALAARLALEQLADDDSRMASTAATTALATGPPARTVPRHAAEHSPNQPKPQTATEHASDPVEPRPAAEPPLDRAEPRPAVESTVADSPVMLTERAGSSDEPPASSVPSSEVAAPGFASAVSAAFLAARAAAKAPPRTADEDSPAVADTPGRSPLSSALLLLARVTGLLLLLAVAIALWPITLVVAIIAGIVYVRRKRSS